MPINPDAHPHIAIAVAQLTKLMPSFDRDCEALSKIWFTPEDLEAAAEGFSAITPESLESQVQRICGYLTAAGFGPETDGFKRVCNSMIGGWKQILDARARVNKAGRARVSKAGDSDEILKDVAESAYVCGISIADIWSLISEAYEIPGAMQTLRSAEQNQLASDEDAAVSSHQAKKECPVKKTDEVQVVLVGSKRKRLNKFPYDVICALIEVYPHRLKKDALSSKSDHRDAQKALQQLAIDPDWEPVIYLPKNAGGGGYGFK